ncbi:MAG: hypothetical protein WC907_05040 [Acholeplasmataceae bacterium]
MVKKITVEVDVNNKKLEEVRKFVRSLEDGVTQVNIKLRDTARKTSEETKKLTNEYENLRTRGFNKIEDSTSNIFDNMERMKAAAEAYHDEIRDTIKEVEDLREMLVLANEEERKELEADIKVRERYLRELKKGARYASGEMRRAAEKTAKKEISGIPETPEEGGLKELMKRWAESLKMTIKGEKEKDSLYNKYRKTLTGVLIDLHILRILGQNSRVVNETFVKMGSVLGALLDVILIPMVQPMVSLMRAVAQLAGYITRMNPLLRTLLSTIFMFIVSLVASLTLIRTGKGMIDWFRGGSKPKQRAAGGPLQPGQSAIVGEKGAEMLVPSAGGGFNVIPNNQLRFLQEGTTQDNSLGGLLTGFTGSLLETTTGGVGDFGKFLGGVMGEKSTQNMLGMFGMIGATIGAVLAPMSGAIGAGAGVMAAGFAGLMRTVKKSAEGTQITIKSVGQSLRNMLGTATVILKGALIGAVVGIAAALGEETGIGPGLRQGVELWNDLVGLLNEYLLQPFLQWLGETVGIIFEWLAEKGPEFVGFLFKTLTDFITGGVEVLDWVAQLANAVFKFLGLDIEIQPLDIWNTIKEKINEILSILGTELGRLPGIIAAAIGGSVGLTLGGPLGGQLGLGLAGIWSNLLGFDFPSFQSGGVMPHDGLAYLHKDETVIPANAAPQVKIDINIAGSVDNRTIDELTRRLKLELTRVRM